MRWGKQRTHSLFNQGIYYFARLPGLREERARALMREFDELILQQATFRDIFGLIFGTDNRYGQSRPQEVRC